MTDDATKSAENIPGGPGEPIPGPDVDPIEQLAHVVPALWRTMKRATRSGSELPANESQVTIMRLVIHHGGLTPAQLAAIMHLARPTVSNLLKDLVRDDLVERVINPQDARGVTIVPTVRGRTVLETFRHDRAQQLRVALERIPAAERTAIVGAVAPLRDLLRALEAEADQVADEVADPSAHRSA